MKLRHPSENKKNIDDNLYALNNNLDEFEYFLLLNTVFEEFEYKIKKIMEMIVYGILEINRKPKEYRRTLKRSK
jgi:hypothetical protein